MFNLFKKKEVFTAPVAGMRIPLEEVKDPVFSQKMMGDGFAVVPSGQTVYAPMSGIISVCFPTHHAIGMKMDNGAEAVSYTHLVGIHGQSILNAVGVPIFTTFITANSEAYLAGNPIPYITATGFIPWFVSLGGAGATLGLVLLMTRSKEKSFSTLGKLALPAGIFNINEPVTFGFPIVMNPVICLLYTSRCV